MITIQRQFIGQPQTMTDERGIWRSAIFRSPTAEPVFLQTRGLAGDQVADTRHHGSPDQAVCCQPLTHYEFWNTFYKLHREEAKLGPGSVGENWTLTNSSEADFAIGDIFRVGETVVQVSAPRYPCTKQERKLKLPSFFNEVLTTMRTGFYLRVLQAGMVQAGDELRLLERPNPIFTIQLINQHTLGEPDKLIAQQMLELPELAEGWKKIIERKLQNKVL